ncbi:14018_t:CDS:1 [Funneliformis geosporum]|uniref:14018_t:CDS:1 n=1 Tax=Funneliformis geosporum TaxID=1117311 RepID=A0A9W4SZQ2_9GLOM|nr:14018_t:CDS:1 [Funneliformis geosporum]
MMNKPKLLQGRKRSYSDSISTSIQSNIFNLVLPSLSPSLDVAFLNQRLKIRSEGIILQISKYYQDYLIKKDKNVVQAGYGIGLPGMKKAGLENAILKDVKQVSL